MRTCGIYLHNIGKLHGVLVHAVFDLLALNHQGASAATSSNCHRDRHEGGRKQKKQKKQKKRKQKSHKREKRRKRG